MAVPVSVSSPTDPRLADYAAVREPHVLRERGVFLGEGRLVLEALLATPRFALRSLLVSKTRARWLEDAGLVIPDDVPVYVSEDASLASITGYRFHQGCLAAVDVPAQPSLEAWMDGPGRAPGPLVVLDGVTNPDNVGAIFRTARAFGAAGVLLTSRACSPLYRKAVRTSMGSTLKLPWWQGGEGVALVSAAQTSGREVWALTLGEGARSLDGLPIETRGEPRPALLVGEEGHGLTPEAEGQADHRVFIPIDRDVDSLNVGAAAAIALYALAGGALPEGS